MDGQRDGWIEVHGDGQILWTLSLFIPPSISSIPISMLPRPHWMCWEPLITGRSLPPRPTAVLAGRSAQRILQKEKEKGCKGICEPSPPASGLLQTGAAGRPWREPSWEFRFQSLRTASPASSPLTSAAGIAI